MLILLTQVLLALQASGQIFGQVKDSSSGVVWFPVDGGVLPARKEIFSSGSVGEWKDGKPRRETWRGERNDRQSEQLAGSRQNSLVRKKESRRGGFVGDPALKGRHDEHVNLVKLLARPTAFPGDPHEKSSFWHLTRRTPPQDAVVFPGPTNANEKEVHDALQDVARDCGRSCPATPQYNPVCGSDGVNYNNLGALKCAQYCGTRVTLSHYGVCGGGLPSIFKPRPRKPKSTAPVSGDGIAWNDR